MIERIFWKNKCVLVTGHTGFKGSWLTSILLNLKANVIGYSLELDNSNYLYKSLKNYISKDVKNYFGDILDKKLLNKVIKENQPDVIFHLAAQSLVKKSYAEPIATWETNLIGSLNLLEAARNLSKECSLVMITTDKVYKNNEWEYSYRENDILGGNDPYSSSKAATEIAISSWRKSFCSKETLNNLYIATARSGNVIGGGDWAEDRIVPDCIRALKNQNKIVIRNPNSRRPWQHVLEPLMGYLLLAEKLYTKAEKFQQSFNFGPKIESNKTVLELVDKILEFWTGEYQIYHNLNNLKECKLLNINSEKSYQFLGWQSIWDFSLSVEKTVNWYKDNANKEEIVYERIIDDFEDYINFFNKNIG